MGYVNFIGNVVSSKTVGYKKNKRLVVKLKDESGSIELVCFKGVSWIEKATLTLLKERSYDRRGDLAKEKEFEYEKRGEYDLIKRVFVKDIHTNHTTEVLFTDIKVDSGLKDALFHERNLKRLPKDQ